MMTCLYVHYNIDGISYLCWSRHVWTSADVTRLTANIISSADNKTPTCIKEQHLYDVCQYDNTTAVMTTGWRSAAAHGSTCTNKSAAETIPRLDIAIRNMRDNWTSAGVFLLWKDWRCSDIFYSNPPSMFHSGATCFCGTLLTETPKLQWQMLNPM